MNNNPFVTIVIPCCNERKFIGECLDSIVVNDYPKEKVEVLVVDGMSEDGTRDIIKRYTKEHSYIRLLDNRKRITPVAMNIGIKNARGDIIMKLDAHTVYGKKYVSNCIKYLNDYEADNVGGVLRAIPRDDTLLAKTIVTAISHPFGVGSSFFRIGSKRPIWVDTVSFGCYRKEIFKKIGFYDENLARGQDMELNQRLRKAGGKILLHPDIISNYYLRSSFKGFFRSKVIDGFWATYPLKFVNHMPVALRHLVPLVFVTSLVGLGLLSFISLLFFRVFLLMVVTYFLINFYFSTKIALKEMDWRYLLFMPFIFTLLHICYGMGSLCGLSRVITSKQFWENRVKGLSAV